MLFKPSAGWNFITISECCASAFNFEDAVLLFDDSLVVWMHILVPADEPRITSVTTAENEAYNDACLDDSHYFIHSNVRFGCFAKNANGNLTNSGGRLPSDGLITAKRFLLQRLKLSREVKEELGVITFSARANGKPEAAALS